MATPDFRALFEHSPNLYMVLDRDLRYVAANRAYLGVTGRTLDSLQGQHVIAAFPHDPGDPHNDNARMLLASFEKVLRTRSSDVLARIVYRVPRDDGGPEERVWSATHTPVLGPDGAVEFILQHTVEVTGFERGQPGAAAALEAGVLGRALAVQAENTLLASELRSLRQLLEQSPGFAAVLKGPEHVFELTNPAYEQIVGRTDLVGKSVLEALPELRGQGIEELLDGVYQSGVPFVAQGLEVRLRPSPDAQEQQHFLDFVYQPIKDDQGRTRGIFVQGHDITEQRRLLGEYEGLAAIVEQSGDFIAIYDHALKARYVNEAGRHLLHLDRQRAATSTLGELFETGEASYERDVLPQLARDGRFAGESLLHCFDGSPGISVWCNIFALRDPGTGAQLGTAVVARDIRPQKEHEGALARVLQAEQLARADAERASRIKDEFLATVSHELRTPLSAMIGWLHLLRGGQLPADRVERALEVIDRNARAQQRLVEDILDVSSIVSGKFKLHVESVRVADVVESAVEAVRPSAVAKDIRMQLTLDGDATVLGDAARVQQMVWNLLSNSVKFTPRGGTVRVTVALDDSAVEIRVTDNGQGIPQDFLPFVFDRFRQADGGITRRYGGLGLGLSIVKQLVEMHGGTVQVASDGRDRGASFLLRLPVAIVRAVRECPPGAAPLQFAPAPEVGGVRGRLILVIDDEPDSRELLAEALRGAGSRVSVAGSVQEGLRAFADHTPDLVVSDIGMPGEDGYALVRAIRALSPERGGRVPAVALTAMARAEDRKQALLAGFKAHVPKPVDIEELLAVLNALLP
jgi:PAS domain S-box-containing protein